MSSTMSEIYGFKINLKYKDVDLDDLCNILLELLRSTFYLYVFNTSMYVYVGKLNSDLKINTELIDLTDSPNPDKDKFIEYRKVTKHEIIKYTDDIKTIIDDYIQITQNNIDIYKLSNNISTNSSSTNNKRLDRAYNIEFPIVFGILLLIVIIIYINA